MTLLSPWALVGLIAIAAPIVAHLLARRPPRVVRFPSLRFLPSTYALPVRRDRLADVPLMVLRVAIVAAAALALAQPLWLTAERTLDLESQVARAVVVDSSASMTRPFGAGGTALDAARARAREAVTGATISRIAESSRLADLFQAAATWLATQSMRRELVVISDFQSSAMSKAELDRVPAGIGVHIIRIPATGSTLAPPPPSGELELLAGPAERGLAAAALAAAVSRGAPSHLPGDRPIAIVFPTFEAREQLGKSPSQPNERWMFDLFATVSRDSLVGAAARATGRPPSEIIRAAGDPTNRERLLLFVDAPPYSVIAAAVMSAVLRNASPSLDGKLIEATYTDDELRFWERPASNVPDVNQSRTGDWSDARLVWGTVLLLLFAEFLIRRRRPAIAPVVEHARVA